MLRSVPSSCTPCQSVLIVSISNKKYRFGVPFKVDLFSVVLSKLDCVNIVMCALVCTFCSVVVMCAMVCAVCPVVVMCAMVCAFRLVVFSPVRNCHLPTRARMRVLLWKQDHFTPRSQYDMTTYGKTR